MATHLRLNLAVMPSTTSKSTAKPRYQTVKIRCIGWDPEGILGAPKAGHIARLEFKKRLEKDADAREAFERQVREEKERRKALRESRVIPDSKEGLVEYLLDTEAQEIEFEIARLRPRLNEDFFSHLKIELGKLRFAVSKTQDMEDRVIELETLEKALQEGIEAYDKMQSDLVTARKSLMKLLTSDDIKATLLDMVEQNELNRSLLTLLDENIANAYQGNQTQAAEYMEKIRGAMLKYITV
ncbi:ribosomal L22e protein family [Striga asiatica]|uniref:Ribosomal L22e protein family n=1 Tax=Striga asiatica TaxID=4170 RepID=A0A5A7P528_STRAF|nr:ribosomal L22e protein family [Striga asiatica]